jgi:hypothetical protein
MLDESEKAWLDDHLNRLHQSLRDLHQKADQLMSDQSHLDTDVQTLTSYFGSIEDEIASLKGQPGAAALDFTGLDALVATVKAAVPAPTTDTAPPADTAPAAADPADNGDTPAPAPADPTVEEAAATTDPAVSGVIVPSPDPETVTPVATVVPDTGTPDTAETTGSALADTSLEAPPAAP